MDEIAVTSAMIEAGIDALAFVGDIDAETVVEVIYRAMMKAAAERSLRRPSGLPN
jgi:hypothetical protein